MVVLERVPVSKVQVVLTAGAKPVGAGALFPDYPAEQAYSLALFNTFGDFNF